MKQPLRVLCIEDSEDDALLLRMELEKGGYEPVVQRVETAAALTAALAEQDWDVIISDYRLPGFDGLAALKLVQEQGRDVPFILVSGAVGEELAVAAMKAGADDFLVKDRLSRLVPAVERELREAESRRQRRRSEESLLRAKQEWERTFDSVPDLIAILDTEHRIVRANRAMARRLGLTPEECVGQFCFSCVHGASCPPESCPHRQTLADGQEHSAEVREELLGGDFLVSTTPLWDEQGRMVGSVHVARDITDRKRTEDQLRRSAERLELLSTVASRLLASNQPEELVEELCHKVMEHLGCDVFFNYLVADGDRPALRLNHAGGIPPEAVRQIEHLDLGQALCGYAAQDAAR